MPTRQELRYGLGLVLLVTALSLLISAQGWKSRLLAFDLLTYRYAAQELIEAGTLPQHGDTGSYGSYKPPGTAWIMAPGTVLVGDPRAAAYVGTALLHFATLLGVWLLGRRCFGPWPAALAVVMYGLSAHGLFLAGSLWPNGRPEFYVWFVLLTSLWATRRDGRYLAAAVTVWAMGMYVDLALAPALLILPVVWLFYRPPVRPVPLLVSAIVVLTAWSPYLKLEATRGFADIKSMLLLRYILPENYRQAWCDTTATLGTWSNAAVAGATSPLAAEGPSDSGPAVAPGLAQRLGMFTDKVLSNFTNAVPNPGPDVLLLALVLGTIVLCAAPGTGREEPGVSDRGLLSPRKVAVAGTLLIAGSLVLHLIIHRRIFGTVLPASGVANKLPQVSLLVGLILLGAPRLAAAAQHVLGRLGVGFQPTLPMRLLVISLVVPWLVLVVLAEPGKPERFWWVWPVQVIFLAAFVGYVLPRFPIPRLAVVAAQVAVVCLVVLNWFLFGRVDDWRRNGWAGKDPEEVQVIDYVGGLVRGEGKSEAAIGYRLFFYPFMAQYHITNPTYRVGGELELMLRYRHGIENVDQCAEGVSPVDEYRIVQVRPKSGADEPRHYVVAPSDDRFRLVRRFGLYEVHKRQ